MDTSALRAPALLSPPRSSRRAPLGVLAVLLSLPLFAELPLDEPGALAGLEAYIPGSSSSPIYTEDVYLNGAGFLPVVTPPTINYGDAAWMQRYALRNGPSGLLDRFRRSRVKPFHLPAHFANIPWLVPHRGLQVNYPANSIEAFKDALRVRLQRPWNATMLTDLGFKMIEVDVALADYGRAVVISHDSVVNPKFVDLASHADLLPQPGPATPTGGATFVYKPLNEVPIATLRDLTLKDRAGRVTDSKMSTFGDLIASVLTDAQLGYEALTNVIIQLDIKATSTASIPERADQWRAALRLALDEAVEAFAVRLPGRGFSLAVIAKFDPRYFPAVPGVSAIENLAAFSAGLPVHVVSGVYPNGTVPPMPSLSSDRPILLGYVPILYFNPDADGNAPPVQKVVEYFDTWNYVAIAWEFSPKMRASGPANDGLIEDLLRWNPAWEAANDPRLRYSLFYSKKPVGIFALESELWNGARIGTEDQENLILEADPRGDFQWLLWRGLVTRTFDYIVVDDVLTLASALNTVPAPNNLPYH